MNVSILHVGRKAKMNKEKCCNCGKETDDLTNGMCEWCYEHWTSRGDRREEEEE
jgi:predicted amidophosphoribosyltransferase